MSVFLIAEKTRWMGLHKDQEIKMQYKVAAKLHCKRDSAIYLAGLFSLHFFARCVFQSPSRAWFCFYFFTRLPPSLFLMGRLRVLSLERSTVGAFAVSFRVLSRQKYDTGTIWQSIDFFVLSHSLLICCIRQSVVALKLLSLRGAKKISRARLQNRF